MNITYTLCEKTYKSKRSERIAYGIAAYAEDGQTCITKLHDVTSDKDALAELVELCNRLQLSPIHLHDVIEDFLPN